VSQIRRKSGIGNPIDIGTLVSKSRNREKRSGPSIWKDTWQRSRESRDIGHREIGVLEVMRTGTSKVPKARESIRTVQHTGQVSIIGKSREIHGKNPDIIKAVHLWDGCQPSITHRKIGDRRFGDFVNTKLLHFETAKSETPKQREAIRTVHHLGRVSEPGKESGIGNRSIWAHKNHVTWNRETRFPDKI
jgi:hypothetical protein